MRCTQCGELLRGYFEFRVCSACYTFNVNQKQKELLKKEKSK